MVSQGPSARTLVERMYRCIKGSSKADYREFTTACIQLARMIDVAMAKNQKLSIQQELTQLLKKVCEHRGNEMFQPAIMVLLMSVKNAICFGWFTAHEKKDLLSMSKELLDLFTGVGVWNTVENAEASQFISTILPRFCPLMTLHTLIIALEAKIGYEAMVCDFYVLKKPSQAEELRLFVLRKDNQDTSTCLVNPNHVNFLINGKGVEKRSLASPDSGPQMPTNVTGMLRTGTNLLQIVGDFPGPYLIAIALTVTTTNLPSPLNLQIYNHYGTKDQHDDELIEGPSRVSLNCPISHKRIMSPVKGAFCKHHQCFDYYSFMEINSRRPSWRCPYCSTHLSFPDLRLDLQMLKILKEVANDTSDVMVSEDGSWKLLENLVAMNSAEAVRRKGTPESSAEEGEICLEDLRTNVVDLTEGNEHEIESSMQPVEGGNSSIVGPYETEDRKPDIRDISLSFTTNVQACSTATLPASNFSMSSLIANQSLASMVQPLSSEMLPTDMLQERQSSHDIYRAPIAIQALPAQMHMPNANLRSRLPASNSQPNSPATQPSNVSYPTTTTIVTTNNNSFILNQRTLQVLLPSFVGLHEGQVSLTPSNQANQQDGSTTIQLTNTIQLQQQGDLQQSGEGRDTRQRIQQSPGTVQTSLEYHNMAGRYTTNPVRIERDPQFQQQLRVPMQFQQQLQLQPQAHVNVGHAALNMQGMAGVPMYNSVSVSSSVRRQMPQVGRTLTTPAPDLAGFPDSRTSIARMRGTVTTAGRVASMSLPSVVGQQNINSGVNVSPAVGQQNVNPGAHLVWLHGVPEVPQSLAYQQSMLRVFPGGSTQLSGIDLPRQWSRNEGNTCSLQSIQTASTLVTDFENWLDMQADNSVPTVVPQPMTGNLFDLDDLGPL